MFRIFHKPDAVIKDWEIPGGNITMERRKNIIDVKIINKDENKTKVHGRIEIYSIAELKKKKIFTQAIIESNTGEALNKNNLPQIWYTKQIKNTIIKYSETANKGFIFKSDGDVKDNLNRLFFNANVFVLNDVDYFMCTPYVANQTVAKPNV